MSPEAWLFGGYAVFLLVAAVVLEALSAHTHRRSLRYRTAGFDYDSDHDHWRCPEGEHLWRHEVDHERRLARYRARAHVCNACHRKVDCTDSDHGREIVRPLDPWPHSEAGRFHRGLSLLLVAVSLLIVAVTGARNPEPLEAAFLLALLSCRSSSGVGCYATSAPSRQLPRADRAPMGSASPSRAPTAGARGGPGITEANRWIGLMRLLIAPLAVAGQELPRARVDPFACVLSQPDPAPGPVTPSALDQGVVERRTRRGTPARRRGPLGRSTAAPARARRRADPRRGSPRSSRPRTISAKQRSRPHNVKAARARTP